MNAVVLPLPGNTALATTLAAQLGATLGELTIHAFPDRETYVRIHTPVTGGEVTLIETITHLKRAGMPAPVCVGVHAVMAGSADADLLAAGAATVVTCNTIAHASNGIDVTPLIAEAVRALSPLSSTVP